MKEAKAEEIPATLGDEELGVKELGVEVAVTGELIGGEAVDGEVSTTLGCELSLFS